MSQDVRVVRVINTRPEVAFDEFTGQEAFYSEPGWTRRSECDHHAGRLWTVTFGPSRDERYRHDHIFRVIDRPSHLVVDTTESRPDGSVVEFEIEFIFEARAAKRGRNAEVPRSGHASSRDVPVIRQPVRCCRLSSGELLHEGGVVAYGPVLDALAVDDADDVHLLIGEASPCGR